MENCVYRGRNICSFDLKDENGYYYEDLVLEWKQAAADRLLTCGECNAKVYLAAGPIKEPYFAHYDAVECEYGNGQETEELKKGKCLLYQLLKRSFPNVDIKVRFRMDNSMYNTFYCENDDGYRIAVDYRLQNNSLAHFQARDAYYKANNIVPIYVLGSKLNRQSKQIDWYQNLIQGAMGYFAFLDTKYETLLLKKSFGYRMGQVRKYKLCEKSYPMRELKLRTDGLIDCDFDSECAKTQESIQQEKELALRKKERLNRQQEERLRLQLEEEKRMEAYRRQQRMEGLDPDLLNKCRKMIEEGNGHLVSKKYFDAIMNENHER